jgi:uncharacterized protein YdcH (DUF465 family)
LAKSDTNFRRLELKHQEYDERLEELRARRYLSEEEKVEEIRLKKLKLALKDQMEEMIRHSID